MNWRVLVAAGLVAVAFAAPKLTEPPAAPAKPVVNAEYETLTADVPDPKRPAYMRDLYSALGYVIARDGEAVEAQVKTTDDFRVRHRNTLRLAIDRVDVGTTPGLGEAIDKVFARAVGSADDQAVTPEIRAKLVKACEALAWRFGRGL